MNTSRFIGIVRDAKFAVLATDSETTNPTVRLSSGPPEEEPQEIALTPYEGLAILVRGVVRQDGWIHAATVVEQGGELLTAALWQSFHHGERGVSKLPSGL